MKRPRFTVDFNDIVDLASILLSMEDQRKDCNGH